jgi:thioredoxin 1
MGFSYAQERNEMIELYNFQTDVIDSDAPLTVGYFTAPWCGPCRMLKPRLEELENENLGLTVVRIDASIETELAAQFQIMTVPTLLLYAGHFQVGRIEGIKPKNVLQETFSKWL